MLEILEMYDAGHAFCSREEKLMMQVVLYGWLLWDVTGNRDVMRPGWDVRWVTVGGLSIYI